MNTPAVIRDWLAQFDSIIDRNAAQPAEVKSDRFLRRVFELAFPPQNLPQQLVFNTDDEANALQQIVQQYCPYYSPKTTKTTKLNSTSQQTTINTKLVLKRKDLNGVNLILSDLGYLVCDSTSLKKANPVGTVGKSKSKVSTLLKLHSKHSKDLANHQANGRDAKTRRDMPMVKHWQSECERTQRIIESLADGL